MNYQDINAKAVDSWVEEGWEWGRPVTHEEFMAAKRGDWKMVLTPTLPVPKEWYPDLQGKNVLGLACGGGQQMPVFAALGANCTVLDYSLKQLDSERMVAGREGYDIRIVRADMTKPLPFSDDSFDLIFHPVSNCYIEHVLPVWRECYRVLKPGGRLMAGLDNGFQYLTDWDGCEIKYSLPFNPLKDEALYEKSLRDNDGIQFSHTLDEQIRGQIQAGLRLIDLFEDVSNDGISQKFNIPAFWVTLSQKP
ncbi:MAG: class I SAM-dependent methyltransferase [Bacillota bacterium]